MFCFIAMNWRGELLVSHQTVVQLISGTTTKSGLTIRAELDENVYQKWWWYQMKSLQWLT